MRLKGILLWWYCAAALLVLIPVAALLAALLALLVELKRQWQPVPRWLRRRLCLTWAVLVMCGSLLLLSGCGTAPLAVPIRPPVPAELLTPPARPVLLIPDWGLMPPGPTTPPTPKAVPLTGKGTSS